jgi:hypothetical protein
MQVQVQLGMLDEATKFVAIDVTKVGPSFGRGSELTKKKKGLRTSVHSQGLAVLSLFNRAFFFNNIPAESGTEIGSYNAAADHSNEKSSRAEC